LTARTSEWFILDIVVEMIESPILVDQFLKYEVYIGWAFRDPARSLMWGILFHVYLGSQPTTTNVEKEKDITRGVAGSEYAFHISSSATTISGKEQSLLTYCGNEL
jgi:hypothetical protein